MLIIAVELPSLTFQRKDISQANLISSILFGDGAAAVVVSGNGARGPKILVSETYTFPDSLGAMGFDLQDSGFHILLAKDVPEMIGAKDWRAGLRLPGATRPKRGKRSRDGSCIPAERVCSATWKQQLGLTKCDTQPSWDILGNVGNLSSATILFILQEWLEKRPLKPGEYARGGGVRSGLQRGVSATAMDLSVIAFLALLLAVALLRFVELRISSRHQQEMIARGAAKVDEPRFRWMVLLHTAVLAGRRARSRLPEASLHSRVWLRRCFSCFWRRMPCAGG